MRGSHPEAARDQLSAFNAGVVVYDSAGVALWTQTFAAGLPIPSEFRRVRDTLRPAFSNVFTSAISGDEVFLIAVPILGEDSELKGVLAGLSNIETSLIGATFAKVLEFKAGRRGFAYLVDGKGLVIYHRGISQLGIDLSDTEPVMRATGGANGAVITEDHNGETVVSGFAPVPGTGWAIVTQERWKDVVGPIRGYSNMLLGLLVFGGVLASGLVFFAVGRTLRPIQDLTRGAKRIAGGDFDHTIAARSGDEIQALAYQFNAMAGALKESYTKLERKIEARTTELRESEEKYRTLFEQSSDAIFVSEDGRISDANPAALDMFGFTRSEAIGLDAGEAYVDPDDLARFRKELGEHGSVKDFGVKLRQKGGTEIDCLLTATLRVGEDGRRIHGTIRDVTQRKRADERLRATLEERGRLLNEIQQLYGQEQRRADQMRAINEVAVKISSILTVDELLPYVATLMRDSFGYYNVNIVLVDPDTGELVELTVVGGHEGETALRRRYEPEEVSVIGQVAKTGESLVANDVFKEPRYHEREEMKSTRAELAVPIKVEDRVVGVLDIESTELNAFDEADLSTAQTVTNQMAVAIQNARLFGEAREMAVLEERNRMAREMHDTLAQGFTGIVLQLESGEQALDDSPSEAREHLTRARNLARQCLQEARRSVWNLLPQALEHRPIDAALEEEVQRFDSSDHVIASFSVTGEKRALPADVQTALLRICQESLTNVRKHAGATEVSVDLTFHSQAVGLRVQDNGKGFDLDALRDEADHGGFGLIGIEQRTNLLRGRLDIKSDTSTGTLVEVRIPTA